MERTTMETTTTTATYWCFGDKYYANNDDNNDENDDYDKDVENSDEDDDYDSDEWFTVEVSCESPLRPIDQVTSGEGRDPIIFPKEVKS